MRKDTFLLVTGLLVFITPFLGIPESWKAVLLYTLGTFVVLGALACRLSARMEERCDSNDVFHADSEPVEDTNPEV